MQEPIRERPWPFGFGKRFGLYCRLYQNLWVKWFQSESWKRRVDFVIAGTQKGGTSALAVYLRRHADVGMPESKELHFFSNEKLFRFGRRPYSIYHKHFKDFLTRKTLGEATPIYMYWSTVPKRLWRYNPKMKIIVLLREPVARAYSAWNMIRQLERETRTFSEAIRQELASGVDNLAGQPGFAYIHRGFYAEQLERIWQFFPREQTLIFKSEDLKNNHEETLNRVCDFLEITSAQYIPSRQIQARAYEKPIDPEDKALLREIYQPEIKKLEKLLNWDCSKWLATKENTPETSYSDCNSVGSQFSRTT